MLGLIIGAVVLGIILGYLAKLLIPGRQDIPAWATIGAGIVAALLGGLVARWIGVADTRGFDWWEHLIQLGFAVVAVYFTARLFSNRRRGHTTTNY